MLKESTISLTSFKKLTRERYTCESDTRWFLKKFIKIQWHIDIGDVEIVAHTVYKQSSRPKKNQQPEHYEYQINGLINYSLTPREERLQKKGFRFFKRSDFLTSSLYLKDSDRIGSLLMMTCCVMVYETLEHKIRSKLKVETYPKSDCMWICFYFKGFHLLSISQQQKIMVNHKR